MMSQFKAWIRLPSSDRAGFLRAWFLLLVAEIGLRVSSLRQSQRWLRRLAASPRRSPPIEVKTVVWWVEAAARHHLMPMTCLRRSLVLEALLAGLGFAPRLRLGVRRESETLLAHAWVELDGVSVGGAAGQDTAYSMLRPSAHIA